jgi:acyl-CoA synthetase (AMP-forming)/AMP-acid ligase II
MNINPRNCSTLPELLQQRAIFQPSVVAYTFLMDGESKQIDITYAQLDRQARMIAAQLQQNQTVGDRAILLYPPGLEFISAFFGCLYAGVIAIPSNPPRRNEKNSRLEKILADAQTNLVLTTASFFEARSAQLEHPSELATIQWLITAYLPCDLSTKWQKPLLDSKTIAFLQYTSGSTGSPKGVILNHENLLSNQRIIASAFGHTESSVVVGWLPLFHDMGLIGNMLQPLYLGTRCIFMSPVDFLQQPYRWLKAVSEFKATTSGGPNFGYDLCTRKITQEQKKNLDLSTWDVAFVGAEPVRTETVRKFALTFAPYGFREEAFYPCYGLAETTLFVTGGLKTKIPVISCIDGVALEENRIIPADGKQKGDREIVSCGQPWLDTKVLVVDPHKLIPCPDQYVGEIWVSGSSVAQGYWQCPDETQKTFHAHLIDDANAGSFLRTGDLGFWQNGELFITGRLKDTIIIRGRNYYPQDIELIAADSHPALKKGFGASFSIEEKGEERLVLVHEVERSFLRKINTKEVIESVRRNIVEQQALQVYVVALVEPGSIPITSSGKLRRQACRNEFLAGNLRLVSGHSNPAPSNKKREYLLTP